MYFLTNRDPVNYFPPVSMASPDGIVAFGGDLNPKRVLAAYEKGIFPWYSDNEPIFWFSPDPRCVLFPEKLKIRKSLRPLINKKKFTLTIDQDFETVIRSCKTISRTNQAGTWITDEMEEAFIQLHHLKIAHSVEVWLDNNLAGGLYGLEIGNIFCGESMFSHESNASRVGFIFMVKFLARQQFKLIDCQIATNYLDSLGAEMISRVGYLKFLNSGLRKNNTKTISNEEFQKFLIAQ